MKFLEIYSFFVKNYYLILKFFQVLQSTVLLKKRKKNLKKDATHLKIVWNSKRQKKNIKKRKKNKKWGKVKQQHFFFYFFIQKKLYFVWKHIWKNLVYIATFVLLFFRVQADYWKCSNKTPPSLEICIVLVGTLLRPKVLGNRPGILTWSLITMHYYFFFYICIFQRSTFDLEKKQKHLSRKICASPYTNNRTYLQWNSFSNYVNLKDVYITLKRIRKLLFVLALKVLLICKFLNFTSAFSNKRKEIKLSNICIQFSVWEC